MTAPGNMSAVDTDTLADVRDDRIRINPRLSTTP